MTRKSYGGAYIAMNSRSLGATAVYAWENAEVGVMGAESAVRILHWKKIEAAPEDERDTLRTRLITEHQEAVGDLGHGVSLGLIDEVIAPEDTRARLLAVFAANTTGLSFRGRHGNIPL